MKEKILTAMAMALLQTAFVTACATAGSLFADCIKMKVRESLIRKELKETEGDS